MFTGLLIAMLIIAGAATVVGGGLMLASQKRRLPDADSQKRLGPGGGPSSGSSSSSERGLRDLRVGDIVQYEGRDFLVEGVVLFDEDGHRWLSARVLDGRDERWVVAGMERAGTSRIRVLAHQPDIELSGYPPETLVAGGNRYALDKRGTATARLYGDVGEVGQASQNPADTVVRCRWWRYESPGEACLIVEQWGDLYRALVGRIAGQSDIEMFPGS